MRRKTIDGQEANAVCLCEQRKCTFINCTWDMIESSIFCLFHPQSTLSFFCRACFVVTDASVYSRNASSAIIQYYLKEFLLFSGYDMSSCYSLLYVSHTRPKMWKMCRKQRETRKKINNMSRERILQLRMKF